MLAALLAITPRAGHAAPAKAGSVRNPAAEAVALFQKATVLEREGDKKAAADLYRAAAEANGALHEAEDRASAKHATFVARVIKSFDAAFNLSDHLSDHPALKQSASDWCTKILAAKADDPRSVKIEEKCAQWGWLPPPGPSEAPGPPGPDLKTMGFEGQAGTGAGTGTETGTGTGTGVIVSDDKGPIPPPPPRSPSSPSKPWRGLAIAGGYTLAGGAVFLVLALAGAVRQSAFNRQNAACTEPYTEVCNQRDKTGKALRPLTAASVITGVLLTGTGATLLTVAMRRRAAKVALAPAFTPQFVGLSLRGRF